MEIEYSFRAYGHKNIKATHRTTFEITKEPYLTERGDCIIAVKAEKACIDLPEKLKRLIMRDDTKIIIELNADGEKDVITAYGSAKLLLTSKKSMVIRKSKYIDDRTLAIKADKAARDINRKLIEVMKKPGSTLNIKIIVIPQTDKT